MFQSDARREREKKTVATVVVAAFYLLPSQNGLPFFLLISSFVRLHLSKNSSNNTVSTVFIQADSIAVIFWQINKQKLWQIGVIAGGCQTQLNLIFKVYKV